MKLCQICGSKASLVSSKMEGYRLGSCFDIYECQECEVSFSAPLEVDSEIYTKIYEHAEDLPGYNRYHAYSRDIKRHSRPLKFLSEQEPCYWFIERYLSTARLSEDVKILEIGSGLGYLTYALNTEGYDTKGVDLSPVSVADASDNFGPYYECKDALKLKDEGVYYDVILLTEVIEHLPQPLSFVDQVKDLLKPGGVILLTTPNKGYEPNKKNLWATELPPVHLWWMNKNSLSAIASRSGLEVSFFSFDQWNKWNFPKYLLKGVRPITVEPVLDHQGGVIKPGKASVKSKRIGKKIKSLYHYWRLAGKMDLSDGSFIAAIFKRS